MHRWELTALKAQRWRREGVKYGGEVRVGESACCQRWMCLEFPGVELSLLSDSPRRTPSSPPTPASFNASSQDSISTANEARSGSVRRHRAGLKVPSALGWSCFTACLLPCGGTIPGVTPSASLMFHFAELFLV